MITSKKVVVLVNLGTPQAPTKEAVRAFLRRFLSDRRVVDLPPLLWRPLLHTMILPFRPQKSVKLYQKIWQKDGSPLELYTIAQQRMLQEKLGAAYQVERAFSYSEPTITQTLTKLEQQGCSDVTIIPLYPQFSTTTNASVIDAVTEFYHGRTHAPQLRVISSFCEQKHYIKAIAAQIKRHWRTNNYDHLVLSYHGIPQKLVTAGDPYEQQCHRTTAALLEQLASISDLSYSQCYQSKFGLGQWLQPATNVTLKKLAEANKKVLVVAPAFVSDCLETKYELVIENARSFYANGGSTYTVVDCVNDGQMFIEGLAALVKH